MTTNSDLFSISQITDNIFLSGISPLATLSKNMDNISSQLGIKYIISCVKRNNIQSIHDNILAEAPDVTILYLPYEDSTDQNLWMTNHNDITILKYQNSKNDYNELLGSYNLYNNKPMIEIGYHFINTAIKSKQNVLIHCMAGISRSVSLTTYFIMKKYCLNFDDAYQFIKNKRQIANPNHSFKLQLKVYHVKRDQFDETDANEIIQAL